MYVTHFLLSHYIHMPIQRFVDRDMFMQYVGGGIGHKSTWPTRVRQENNDKPEGSGLGGIVDDLDCDAEDRTEVMEPLTGEDDEANYDEEEDHGDSDEERDYGYANEGDGDKDETEMVEDEVEDLGPEDGEDNWEADE